MTRTLASLLTAALVLFALGGCADARFDRQAVSGTVTYQNKAIVSGTVVFAPIPDNGPTHVAAVIADGKFVIGKEKGLAPGKYQVRFTANDRVAMGPTDPGAGGSAEPPKQILPPKHNEQSTHEVEIRADGTNVFDFHLD